MVPVKPQPDPDGQHTTPGTSQRAPVGHCSSPVQLRRWQRRRCSGSTRRRRRRNRGRPNSRADRPERCRRQSRRGRRRRQPHTTRRRCSSQCMRRYRTTLQGRGCRRCGGNRGQPHTASMRCTAHPRRRRTAASVSAEGSRCGHTPQRPAPPAVRRVAGYLPLTLSSSTSNISTALGECRADPTGRNALSAGHTAWPCRQPSSSRRPQSSRGSRR